MAMYHFQDAQIFVLGDDRLHLVIGSHQESLHSHDAISDILAPKSKFSHEISHEIWSSLIHKS